MLGQYLNIELSKKFDILTLYNKNKGNTSDYPSAKIDLLNIDSLFKIIRQFKPDVVIHNAAISNAAKADLMPNEIVERINVKATEVIAEECSHLKCKLIYTSTDLVYDGNSGGNLTEQSPLNPVSFYAKTKLQGEAAIKSIFNNYLILRLALLLGFGLNHSRNHFQEVVEKLKKNQSVKLFTDQFRSPNELTAAAKIISVLSESEIENEALNLGGPERLSRFDVGTLICKVGQFDEKLLIPDLMMDSDLKYKVKDVSLNIAKLAKLNLRPPSVEKSLMKILRN